MLYTIILQTSLVECHVWISLLLGLNIAQVKANYRGRALLISMLSKRKPKDVLVTLSVLKIKMSCVTNRPEICLICCVLYYFCLSAMTHRNPPKQTNKQTNWTLTSSSSRYSYVLAAFMFLSFHATTAILL